MRHELRQMPWRNEGYWLLSQGLLSMIFLESRITTDSTAHNGMDPSIIHRLRKGLTAGCCICILSTGNSFLSYNSSVCQADIKSANTINLLLTWHTNPSLLCYNLSFLVLPLDNISIQTLEYKYSKCKRHTVLEYSNF